MKTLEARPLTQTRARGVQVSTKRRSRLATGQITRQLQRLQFPVVLSSDPGRFICNYLYYQSLRSCCPPTAPSGTPGQASDPEDFIPEHALFVHVPPLEVRECVCYRERERKRERERERPDLVPATHVGRVRSSPLMYPAA